ncbi:MAG TPA: ABC transporter substrate-binding protein [Bryobacteraceae bacterium]|nr:ABC transporter substrate-binding protein [Bryobacteraceae bacterium]
MRVVSLLASATEIVCALEAGATLVGRSHECDNPAWVRRLPSCSEPAFDVSMSSGDIDREVRRRMRLGEPLYRIDTDLIRELKPDLIIAQSHCEVCAITPGDLERSGGCIPCVPVLPLAASSLDEIFASIGQVARALDREERGCALVAGERQRLASLRTAGLRRPSLAVLEWTDPIFPMGNWGPELVDIAGAEPALGNREQHSFAIASDLLKGSDPEYVIVAPCGLDLPRACGELSVLEHYLWWHELRAVHDGRVAFADGNLFFNRSGMTVARTAEIIAEIVHGIISGERSEGAHWQWIRELRGYFR